MIVSCLSQCPNKVRVRRSCVFFFSFFAVFTFLLFFHRIADDVTFSQQSQSKERFALRYEIRICRSAEPIKLDIDKNMSFVAMKYGCTFLRLRNLGANRFSCLFQRKIHLSSSYVLCKKVILIFRIRTKKFELQFKAPSFLVINRMLKERMLYVDFTQVQRLSIRFFFSNEYPNLKN